jgi:chaperonin GroEL (HSP60 family)
MQKFVNKSGSGFSRVLRRAMEESLRQIVENAGDEPSVVFNEVQKGSGKL